MSDWFDPNWSKIFEFSKLKMISIIWSVKMPVLWNLRRRTLPRQNTRLPKNSPKILDSHKKSVTVFLIHLCKKYEVCKNWHNSRYLYLYLQSNDRFFYLAYSSFSPAIQVHTTSRQNGKTLNIKQLLLSCPTVCAHLLCARGLQYTLQCLSRGSRGSWGSSAWLCACIYPV